MSLHIRSKSGPGNITALNIDHLAQRDDHQQAHHPPAAPQRTNQSFSRVTHSGPASIAGSPRLSPTATPVPNRVEALARAARESPPMHVEWKWYDLLWALQELPPLTVLTSDVVYDVLHQLLSYPTPYSPPAMLIRQSLLAAICSRLLSRIKCDTYWIELVDTWFPKLMTRENVILARELCHSAFDLPSEATVLPSAGVVPPNTVVDKLMFAETVEKLRSAESCRSFAIVLLDYFVKWIALSRRNLGHSTTPFVFCPYNGVACPLCRCWHVLVDRLTFLSLKDGKAMNPDCEAVIGRIFTEVKFGGMCPFCHESQHDNLTIFARLVNYGCVTLVSQLCRMYNGDRVFRESTNAALDTPSFVLSRGEYAGWNALQIACHRGVIPVVRALFQIQGNALAALVEHKVTIGENQMNALAIANRTGNHALVDQFQQCLSATSRGESPSSNRRSGSGSFSVTPSSHLRTFSESQPSDLCLPPANSPPTNVPPANGRSVVSVADVEVGVDQ